jgi:hypothetical protein
MGELTVVYEAIPANAAEMVAYLESRCLHPVVLDDIEKMGPYRSQTNKVRIAVPQTESDMARHMLAQKQQQDERRLSPVIRQANAAVLLVIAALGLLAAVGLLDSRGWWFGGLSILLAVLAALALLRWAWHGRTRS